MDTLKSPVFFLRHPSTLSNANDIFMGQEEVEILANSLIDLSQLDSFQGELVVYYSPLKRGQQTLLLLVKEIIANKGYQKLILEPSEELKERELGLFQKREKSKIRAEFAKYFKDNIFIPSMTPPNGETFVSFKGRVNEFYLKLKEVKQTSILISHLQVFRMLNCLHYNYDPDAMWSKINCSHGKLIKLF